MLLAILPLQQPSQGSISYALWAFMGVESASVASDTIENPQQNVPLATMIGFVLAAILYLGTSSLLMGLFPAEQIARSSAPFADAALKMVGPLGASVMALCAIFKAFSSLVGWTLIVSQSAGAAAKDNLFLKIYNKPVWNFILSGLLMTAIVIYTESSSLAHEFNRIINIAVILTVFPYLYSAAAFLKMTGPLKIKTSAIVVTARVFCLWVVAGSEAHLVQKAMMILFVSIPLYPLLRLRD
ncbi:MAG: amino acid permease [Myxococcaceae bacterium]